MLGIRRVRQCAALWGLFSAFWGSKRRPAAMILLLLLLPDIHLRLRKGEAVCSRAHAGILCLGGHEQVLIIVSQLQECIPRVEALA